MIKSKCQQHYFPDPFGLEMLIHWDCALVFCTSSWLMLHLGKREWPHISLDHISGQASEWWHHISYKKTEEVIDDVTIQVWWASLPNRKVISQSERSELWVGVCINAVHVSWTKLYYCSKQCSQQYINTCFLTFLSDYTKHFPWGKKKKKTPWRFSTP